MSVCVFNNNYTKPGWLKSKIKNGNLMNINK